MKSVYELLPHRYPFLMIDKVLEVIPDKQARAIKCVSINEGVFQGHFPQKPIFPGALIIEALAQTTALIFTTESQTKEIGYLAGIKNFRFYAHVEPGDLIELHAKVCEQVGEVLKVEVRATRKDQRVAKGVITVTRTGVSF